MALHGAGKTLLAARNLLAKRAAGAEIAGKSTSSHSGREDAEAGINIGGVRHDAPPTPHERKIASEMASEGNDVILRGENTEGPDAIINGKYWEIKEITGDGKRTLQTNIREARKQFANAGSREIGLSAKDSRVLIDARGSSFWSDPTTVSAEISKLVRTGALHDVVELKVVTKAGVVTWRP